MSQAPATWPAADLLAWLLRRPDALEPGLRLGESQLQLELPLTPAASGPDPLGRPCYLFLYERPPAPGLAEELLDTAARLREAQPALEAWYARPAEPRILVLAPEYPLALRTRLQLLAASLGLRAWSFHSNPQLQRLPALRLELPAPARHPSVALPPAPPASLPRLRRLMLHAERIQPPILAHGGAWPVHLTTGEGAIGVLHRDGDELLFVSLLPSGRPQVLRLEDEESVDRALDALQRAQFARALEA